MKALIPHALIRFLGCLRSQCKSLKLHVQQHFLLHLLLVPTQTNAVSSWSPSPSRVFTSYENKWKTYVSFLSLYYCYWCSVRCHWRRLSQAHENREKEMSAGRYLLGSPSDDVKTVDRRFGNPLGDKIKICIGAVLIRFEVYSLWHSHSATLTSNPQPLARHRAVTASNLAPDRRREYVSARSVPIPFSGSLIVCALLPCHNLASFSRQVSILKRHRVIRLRHSFC